MDQKDEEFFNKESENLTKPEKKEEVKSEKVQEEQKVEIEKKEKEVQVKKVEDIDIETSQILQKAIQKVIQKEFEKNFVLKELAEIKKAVVDLFRRRPPEVQKVIGEVETKFPEVQKIEGQVEVKNLPERQKIEDERIVERIERLEKAIRSLKFPEPLKEVKIANVAEFPKPPNVVKISEMPTDELKKIIEVLKANKIELNELVDFFSRNPDYYINVRLTDGKEWYKALSEIVAGVGGGVIPFVDSIGKQKPAKVRDEDQRLEVHVISEKEFTVRTEYDSASNLIYYGEAEPGSLESEAKWRIKKITWSGSLLVDIKWANGDALFTKVWNDRATYNYS
uniref:Uncharacterized protein n=1 Tax=Dictyoglomus turgidum TaxID=513050 RepID=A0A7C3WXX6_9BACT